MGGHILPPLAWVQSHWGGEKAIDEGRQSLSQILTLPSLLQEDAREMAQQSPGSLAMVEAAEGPPAVGGSTQGTVQLSPKGCSGRKEPCLVCLSVATR